ncbi:MAG: metalloregulator ArsR/SmtB family transcription factor [Candidatus Eisenbacteria bacterium]|nr:metalloregulator ArsR/SmtB family transcription factor [Candidatus Eisenbacteria bacterium]
MAGGAHGRKSVSGDADPDVRGDESLEAAAELLRALSHPVRLRIVELLSEGESCVKRLEELLGIPQPSVSQHLSRLRYAGLIESERRGHLVCYRLVEPRGTKILSAALGEDAGKD